MRRLDSLNFWTRLALVMGGFLAAIVASFVASLLYDRSFSPADNQAMGGMIAGGTMILGGGVFCLVSLVPTALALWFLRGSRRFWSAFSFAGLAFAIAGLAAVLVLFATRGATPRVAAFLLVDLLGIMQMLGSPLWVAGFGLFALLAPAEDLRRRLLVAVAIELVIGACGIAHFLMPRAIP